MASAPATHALFAIVGLASLHGCLIRDAPADAAPPVMHPTCAFQTSPPYTGSLACDLPPGPSDQVLTDSTPVPLAPACAKHRYDALIVLGSPANLDGTPSDTNISRVETAIQAHCMGLGDNFIVTGTHAHNQWTEAYVLHDALVARGIPSENIYIENRAEHTDENVYYSTQIMLAQGWKSALIISEVGHLRFAAECDTNCCVKLGSGTLLDYGGTPPLQVMDYVLFPDAPPVSDDLCSVYASRYQCVNLSDRHSCAGMIELPDASTD